jgi:hypothetical protein
MHVYHRRSLRRQCASLHHSQTDTRHSNTLGQNPPRRKAEEVSLPDILRRRAQRHLCLQLKRHRRRLIRLRQSRHFDRSISAATCYPKSRHKKGEHMHYEDTG